MWVLARYAVAPRRHWSEHIEAFVVAFDHVVRIPTGVPRVFLSTMLWLEWSPVRVVGSCVIVLVIDKANNVLVGVRERSRQRHWSLDLGAGGMRKHRQTPEQTAEEELRTELGIRPPLRRLCSFSPVQNCPAFLDVYYTRLNATEPLLKSPDGTFVRMHWLGTWLFDSSLAPVTQSRFSPATRFLMDQLGNWGSTRAMPSAQVLDAFDASLPLRWAKLPELGMRLDGYMQSL